MQAFPQLRKFSEMYVKKSNTNNTTMPREDVEALINIFTTCWKHVQNSQDNRMSLPMDTFEDTGNILKFAISDCDGAMDDNVHLACRLMTHIYRFLRNACITCRRNQNLIRMNGSNLGVSIRYLCVQAMTFRQWCEENPNTVKKVDSLHECCLIAVRCCLQFTGNAIVGNKENGKVVKEKVQSFLTPLIQHSNDRLIAQYAIMNAQQILVLFPDWGGEIDSEIVGAILDSIGEDFSLTCFEEMVKSKQFKETKYINLKSEDRVNFLRILIDDKIFQQSLNLPVKHVEVLEFFKTEFTTKADLIFRADLNKLNEPEAVTEIALLVELMVCLSMLEKELVAEMDGRTGANLMVFKDKPMLLIAMRLLKAVIEVGKHNGSLFAPLEKISDISDLMRTSRLDRMNDHPSFMFKANLIRLLGNLIYRHKTNQDTLRVEGGLAMILSSCRPDARNPFIRECSIVAIRFACEKNPDNQRYIQQMKQETTLPAINISEILKEIV